jgi:[NiFe] hydrogenase assembly HybE family chaperone
MDGVPILNPRIEVEAIGTREWNGHWLTVLVTPWFINLMLLPQAEEQREAWRKLALGSSAAHVFPAGRFDFLVGEEEGLGRYQMCSLFSPVLEFEDHAAARIAGQAALEALFDASLDGSAAEETKAAAEDAAPSANGPLAATAPREVSRRGLFMGKIAPEDGPV